MTNFCKNCNTQFNGKFCNNCGQKIFTDSDKSFKKLFEEGFHFITHFEGTFFTSIKTIFLRPAKLTTDYCSGIRKKYYKPLSLFLLIVVLYLLFPIATGLNMPMEYYKEDLFTKGVVTKQIEQKVSKLNLTEQELSEKFQKKSEKVSKISFFLLIPLTALLFFILYPNKNTKAYDIFILSTEVNIFFIGAYFLLMPFIIYLIKKLLAINFKSLDNPYLLAFLLISFGLYSFLLMKNYFKKKCFVVALKSVTFCLVYAIIVIPLYRFFVFQITMLFI